MYRIRQRIRQRSMAEEDPAKSIGFRATMASCTAHGNGACNCKIPARDLAKYDRDLLY